VVVACRDSYQIAPGTTVLKVDPRYYRPTEVDLLIGDPTKSKEKLGWSAKYTLPELVKEMVDCDLQLFRSELMLKESGFEIKNQYE
jgi:GDPmannose 4,6-dehydratase